MNFFKKLNFYLLFSDMISKNKEDLLKLFGMRVDRVNRLYTVINLSNDKLEEPYDLRKSDVDKIASIYLKDYISRISTFLDSISLKELYQLYEIKKLDKYNYLVVIGFSLFKTHKVANNLFFKIIPTFIVLLVIILLLFII